MDADQLKTRYALDVADLPDPQGLNVVTIARIDTEYYDAIEQRRKVEKVRHQLFLREFRLPLRLNNTRIDVLKTALGTKETDHWIGRKIGLYVGAASNYGKTEAVLMIDINACDHLQAIPPQGTGVTQVLSRMAQGGAFQPPVQQPQAQLPAARPATQPPAIGAAGFDYRPLGSIGAERFTLALKEQAFTLDQVLAWLKRFEPAAYEAAFGKELADWPRGLMGLMKKFLDEFKPSMLEPEKAPSHQAVAQATRQEEDDIPF